MPESVTYVLGKSVTYVPGRTRGPEVARILRISRATLYQRIRAGAIKTHKDGRRTFVTAEELLRYATPRG